MGVVAGCCDRGVMSCRAPCSKVHSNNRNNSEYGLSGIPILVPKTSPVGFNPSVKVNFDCDKNLRDVLEDCEKIEG